MQDESSRRAAKLARLRKGEPSPNDVETPEGEPVVYRQLRQLQDLDERLEASGRCSLLDDFDREIIAKALSHGVINCSTIGTALRLDRSTVWRHIKRLLGRAAYLQRFAETLLGEAEPQDWRVIKAMAKTLASAGAAAGPLDIEGYNRLARMYQGGFEARRLLSPSRLSVERRDGKLLITGPGPLPPILQEAVRAGRAERIYPGPARCHSCGRFISRRPIGRRRKWCPNGCCRSRYRRRP